MLLTEVGDDEQRCQILISTSSQYSTGYGILNTEYRYNQQGVTMRVSICSMRREVGKEQEQSCHLSNCSGCFYRCCFVGRSRSVGLVRASKARQGRAHLVVHAQWAWTLCNPFNP